MILALEIAEDAYEIFNAVSYKSESDNLKELEKMGFLKRIKRGIEFLGDWFSDQPDDYLITEYGFLKAFVDWD